MTKEKQSIEKNCLNLAWHMRGGANINDLMEMTNDQITYINELVDEHMKVVQKTGMPFF